MHSVVDIRPLTEAASSSATLTTFFGSIIPAFIKLVNSPLLASKPYDLSVLDKIFSTTLTPSNPALSAMALQGRVIAFLMILIPRSCSEFFPFNASRALDAYSKAHPPPTTIPYSIAALVAQIASWTLSLIYPTSISDPPPTLKIPTPPTSFDNLYSSFSLS